MELLRTNIATDGKLVGNKQERLSLVEDEGGLDNAKLAESTKFDSKSFDGKKNGEITSSNQSYSPPSAYQSEQNFNNLQVPTNGQGQFIKKKNTYEGSSNNGSFGQNNPRRNSAQDVG